MNKLQTWAANAQPINAYEEALKVMKSIDQKVKDMLEAVGMKGVAINKMEVEDENGEVVMLPDVHYGDCDEDMTMHSVVGISVEDDEVEILLEGGGMFDSCGQKTATPEYIDLKEYAEIADFLYAYLKDAAANGTELQEPDVEDLEDEDDEFFDEDDEEIFDDEE